MVTALLSTFLQQLPPPSKSVINLPKLVRTSKSFLSVPAGFKVNLFAGGLRHPRMMAVAPNGDAFVVETRIERNDLPHPNRVTVLWDNDKNGNADGRTLFADKLSYPFGITFGFDHLYVANTDKIVRWPYSSGLRTARTKPEVVLDKIPSNGYRNHWTRNIRISPDKRTFLLTIGSEFNVAEEGPRRAVIESYQLDSGGEIQSGPQLMASGMRNPIGLDFNPITGALWANVAERDYLGDGLVPDYLTQVRVGGFYGWPYYYIGSHHDPRMPEKPDLRKRSLRPDVLFPAHATAIDIKFITSEMFSSYKNDAFVTLHGSQNRSRMVGYKVVRVVFNEQGRPTGEIKDFVTGWLPKGSNKIIYGRPAGLAFLPDGSLLIADDWAGKIWRVSKR